MNNVVNFPGEKPPFGGGPEDPMLEQRVGKLEEKVDRIEAILTRLEPKISEVLQNTAKQQLDFARFESTAATKDDLHKVQIDLAEIKGRVASLPTWWMLITALITTWGAGFVITNYISKTPAPIEKAIEKAPSK